jgi:hypothetical protein
MNGTYSISSIRAKLPASAGAGGQYVCADTNGTFYKTTTCGAGGAGGGANVASANTWTAPQTFAAGISTAALPGLSATLTPLAGGPITTPTFGLSLPDASKPWMIQAAATSPSTDNNGGVLYVTKDTSYGSLTATGGQYSAIFGLNIVREGVWTNQDGILGSIYNYNTGNSLQLQYR